jgi:hypothetical protein
MRGRDCGSVEGGLTPHHEVLENLFKAALPTRQTAGIWPGNDS